jgi:hypothetical protein
LALPGGNKMYMLGLAAVCWAIWKARNRTCFDKKHIKSPLDIIIPACVFMRYWTRLYSDESKMTIEAGVDILMKTVVNLLGAKAKMKKGEPLPIEKENQAEPDGADKVDESIKWELEVCTVIDKIGSDNSLGMKTRSV